MNIFKIIVNDTCEFNSFMVICTHQSGLFQILKNLYETKQKSIFGLIETLIHCFLRI